jgi:hypothetical protein
MLIFSLIGLIGFYDNCPVYIIPVFIIKYNTQLFVRIPGRDYMPDIPYTSLAGPIIGSIIGSLLTLIITIITKWWQFRAFAHATIVLEVNARIKQIIQSYEQQINELKNDLKELQQKYEALEKSHLNLKTEYDTLLTKYNQVCQENIVLKSQMQAMKNRLLNIEYKVNGNNK